MWIIIKRWDGIILNTKHDSLSAVTTSTVTKKGDRDSEISWEHEFALS